MVDLRVIVQSDQAIGVIAQPARVEHRVCRLSVDMLGQIIDESIEIG
ncbi:hypothetical protein PS862_05886 [Pseudomonas fluorescens]|uniref:Uncharacterized protein n=1 Tax=Pseudomonas fluorescens TaxID=294 RepID=A0A5E7QB21_PSEFL|nr:hypothetical protein PS862_05886 [Pseudomonas fluorescens]